MPKGEPLFYGIVFFSGMEQLPGDIALSLVEIRKWALNQGYITDPEFQLLLDDRVNALSSHFDPEDQLQIALAIHPGRGDPFYFEYPYLPVKSLIRRAVEVELYYWRMIPTRWDSNGRIIYYGETKFGFLVPGCNAEICSLSTAKRVVDKFQTLISDLSNEYPIEEFPDGSREITVDGAVLARFLKDGRHFNITLSSKH